MEKRDLTRLLGWPGYRVYRYELDEASKRLKLWVQKNQSIGDLNVRAVGGKCMR